MSGNERINIDFAEDTDAGEILDLQKKAYLSEALIYDDYTIHAMVQSLDDVLDEFGRMLVLKAVCNDRIVGSVRGSVDNGVLKVHKLIVDPDFQNRGLGTSLVSTLEQRVDHPGGAELFTGYRSDKNIHLYTKLGYELKEKVRVNDKLFLVHMVKK